MTGQDRTAILELMKSANARIRTTDIKGKSYAEVPQRIKAFRSVFPELMLRALIRMGTEKRTRQAEP